MNYTPDELLKIYNYRHLNPTNQFINLAQINKIFRKFKINDVQINDISIFQRAFIDASYLIPDEKTLEEEFKKNTPNEREINATSTFKTDEIVPLQPLSYESLEFLGDGILGSIVIGYIHKRYRKEKEGEQGFLTDLKNQLIRGTLLCILAKRMKFNRFIVLSKKCENNRNKDDKMEDVFEAFIGALYIDQGENGYAFGICQQFIVTLMERYLDFGEIIHRQDNYKAQLGRYYHAHFFGADPEYKCISRYGPTYDRTFKCAVLSVDGLPITYGEGHKKIYAEQAAAKAALKYFGEEVYSDSEAPDREVFSDSDSESI